MRFLRQSLTGLFLLAATLGVLVYAATMVADAVRERMAREARAPRGQERVLAVEVIRAQPRTVTPILTAFGEVRSRRSLDLRAATGGTVVSLAAGFVEGGRVAAGDVLMQIDPANAQSALDRARADLADAEAEGRDAARALELARDEVEAARAQAALRQRALQRQRDLATRGVGTAAAVEAAELAASSAAQAVLARRQALAQAEARTDKAVTRLARMKIGLQDAERRLADTTLRAGFAGTLADVSVVEGGLVSPNERLARLIDPTALEVAIRLSTPQYSRLLDPGGQLRPSPVSVTLEMFGVDLTAHGRISRDSAAVGEGQTGRLVFAGLDNAAGFKPGDFVTVKIEEPPVERVVQLPSSAINAAQEVLVLGADERLETLAVTLLRRQGDDVLVRGEGLGGREVVARRTPLLGGGIRVKPLRRGALSAVEEPEMIDLSSERQKRLIGYVSANTQLPEAIRTRILTTLETGRAPARMVARIESRMGG